SAREAAGLSVDRIDGQTVGEVLDEARRRYGEQFAAVLTHSRVWVNGAPADVRAQLREGDVVAVLPPVSGGSDTIATPRPPEPPARPPLEEPLPFTKPESDKSASGWFRPPEIDDIEGSLARLPTPAASASAAASEAASLNGNRRTAAAPIEREPLTVVPDTDMPHVRLGLAWITVTIAATVGGSTTLGLWMSVMAAVAAIQVTKAWMERHERPVSYVAVAGAAALPLAAIGGLDTVTGILVLAVVVTMVARVSNTTKAPSRDVALTLMIIVPIGMACAAPVLLRNLSLAAPLAVFAFAAAHDMGAYLVGTGAGNDWEGPVAGVAAIFCVTLFVAVLVPAFGAGGPFLLGLVAAILTPLGPLAASIVLGDRDAKAPALRRLDSLLLFAPVGAWVAAVLLH